MFVIPRMTTRWAKTAEEAIDLLKTGKVEYASLDHDLGFGGSGYDVVCWVEENDQSRRLMGWMFTP